MTLFLCTLLITIPLYMIIVALRDIFTILKYISEKL